MKTDTHTPVLGGTSLMVIFCILCLTVFSMLTLSAAQAERRLSESFAESATSYYQAEVQAEMVFAQLRSGSVPDCVQHEGSFFSYQIPVSRSQLLQVRLLKEEKGWTILQWQILVHSNSAESPPLPLWEGNPIEEVSP